MAEAIKRYEIDPGAGEPGVELTPLVLEMLAQGEALVANTIDVKVPDIGDYKDVPIIEVLVKSGDVVKADQSLVTLESDKATMDVPAPQASGVVARFSQRSATRFRWARRC